jgi:hypothetical protein
MATADRTRILTINAGSSSLKAALYDMDQHERLPLAVQVEQIIGQRRRSQLPRSRASAWIERVRVTQSSQTVQFPVRSLFCLLWNHFPAVSRETVLFCTNGCRAGVQLGSRPISCSALNISLLTRASRLST